jgi:hypothetical protein
MREAVSVLGVLEATRVAACALVLMALGPGAASACECDISLPPVTGNYSPEVIVEGVVSEPSLIKRILGGLLQQTTSLRVTHAWKGEFGESATLSFSESDTACNSPPPFGESIIIRADRDASDAIRYTACSRLYEVDAPFRAKLEAYKKTTETIAERARAGRSADRLAFAEYLRDNRESRRALQVYRSLYQASPADIELLIPIALLEGDIRGGDPKPTLRQLRELAPDTAEWRRKVAYTAFEAACEIDASRKDWSNVRSGERCKYVNAQLENANFDGADLGGARFKDANLAGASFKGANLSGTSFDGTSLIGTYYDCNTRYNGLWFNPIEAGMIKVEGKCFVQP